ncbi:MAG TPA: GNAT family protein [Pseudonocardiaceae bacterium]|jgi:ribosomal-protein-alanine N-acetyltransferase
MTRHPGWPARLNHERVGLRPPRLRDASAWSGLRLRNEAWLAPWEPTSAESWRARHSAAAWPSLLSSVRRSARAGALLPFVVTYDDRFVGQLTVNNIVRGALRSGQIGYWVDQEHAGRGVITTAVALVTDHCFGPVGLHRVQVDIRPENVASRRVVAKLGFREEGYLQRYLDIDGAWRDHVSYALTVEDVPGGLMRRLGRPTG